jgi:hypothetical protein
VRARIADDPDRLEIGDPDRKSFGREPVVEPLGTRVPDLVQAEVHSLNVGALQMAQELVHRAHDIGMGVEGSPGKTHIERTADAVTPHQRSAAAEHADR